MEIPFTVEQFYGVFREYNEALWPAQWVLTGVSVAGIGLLFRPRRWTHVALSGLLAFLWAWMALVYHVLFFTRINPLAYGFAGLSLIGAGIFVWEGVIRRRLKFAWSGGWSWIGALLVLFALLVYPAWSWTAGHPYPTMPTFGLPCPTTLYTIGLLLFLVSPYPGSAFVVPILWSAIGAQAAFFLGVPQDLSLIVAGSVGVVFVINSRGKARKQ